LAGKSSANNVNCADIGTTEFGDIGVYWYARPMFCEDFAAEWIDLAERNGSHSGSLKSEGKAADAAEEVKDIQSTSPRTAGESVDPVA